MGKNAGDMLQALNTGHEGSLGTAHANSCRDMLARLGINDIDGGGTGSAASGGEEEGRSPLAWIFWCIWDVCAINQRKLLEVSEVCAYADGEIRIQPLISMAGWVWSGACGASPAQEKNWNGRG